MNRRPFADVDEMNETMIERWNAVVRPQDTVYHLGDFAYRLNYLDKLAIHSRLNGTKHLVVGNHDDGHTKALDWPRVDSMREIVVDSQRLFLCHYPMLEWPHYHRGAWHLFGHCHGNTAGVGRSLDVGVDCWDFAPVSLSQIRARLRERGAIE